MPHRSIRVSLAALMVSAAVAGGAHAARRHGTNPVAGPATPEIRLSGDNRVPACVTPDRLMRLLASQNDHLDPKYKTIAVDYQRHGEALRVRWDFAFYQMLLETNYLKFRKGDGTPGDVKPRQNNFAGLGATGNGVPGETFPDVSTGVLAQMQHLVAYSGEMVNHPVAIRTRDNQDGIIAQSKRLGRPVHFADLTNRWAADSSYARSIISVSDRFRDGYCKVGQETAETAARAAVNEKPMGFVLAGRAAERQPVAPRSGLGVSASSVAAPQASTSSACQVMSASFGGAITLLIRAETVKGVTLTALDVRGGSEDAQAAAYIVSHAPGGKIINRFSSRTEAVDHAYKLCDSGRP